MLDNAVIRRLYLFWLPMILLILGILYLSQSRYKAEQEAQYALHRLNHWRKQAGLQAFESSTKLQKAAQNHALYLSKNPDGHNENHQENPYFSGTSPAERAIAVGYPSGVGENLTISKLARSGKRGVDGLMTALYHRLSLLNPDDNEAGTAWAYDKYQALVIEQGDRQMRELCESAEQNPHNKRYILTMKCAGQTTEIPLEQAPSKTQTIVKFPIGTQIEPSYDGMENPNPMPKHGKTGNPISIAFHGFDEKQPIQMLSFKLYKNKTLIEDVKILNYQNDPNHLLSPFEFALFPLKPLDFNTEYRVYFHYAHQQQEKTETWTFKTRPKNHLLEFHFFPFN